MGVSAPGSNEQCQRTLYDGSRAEVSNPLFPPQSVNIACTLGGEFSHIPCGSERVAAMPHLLIRHLEQFGPLSHAEKQALAGAATRVRSFGPDQDLVSDGDYPTDCKLILNGYACTYKLLPDGRRQIMSFQIPGDICDLQGFFLGEMDHAIGTLTAGRIAIISHEELLDLTQTYPRIARALSQSAFVDAAIFREWMVGIGRRSAYARIAHLLCEMGLRLKAVGLNQDDSYELPVTQAELADALGLTSVHVNRTLQQLRRQGLITLRGGTVTLSDPEGLARAGQFDSGYLYVGRRNAIDVHPRTHWQEQGPNAIRLEL
jgi:CRP-like cAMP-binding protein